MSYKYKRWVNGDDVTIERLNRIENAVADYPGDVMVISGTMSYGTLFTLDTTYSDIRDAFLCGIHIVVDLSPDVGVITYEPVLSIRESTGYYSLSTLNYVFVAEQESGYPKHGTEK